MFAEAISVTELRDARLTIANAISRAGQADEEETHVVFPETLTRQTRDILLYDHIQEGYECSFRLVERNGGASLYYFNIRWKYGQ